MCSNVSRDKNREPFLPRFPVSLGARFYDCCLESQAKSQWNLCNDSSYSWSTEPHLYLSSQKIEANLTTVRAQVLLKRFGYRSLEIEDALFRLRGRFTAEEDFPHEIGLFLGYPIEDVEGFIANGGKGCKCSGCWKVYGDVEKAQALFDSYKECRRRLMTQWNHGASVTSLAVAL